MPPKAAKGKKKETTKEESSSVPPEKNEPTEREIQLRSQYVLHFFESFSVLNFKGTFINTTIPEERGIA